MTEQSMVDIPREGASIFKDTDADTSGEATAQNNDENDEEFKDDESDEDNKAGDGQADEDKLPFHKHPDWKRREEEWTKRFNDQEVRHQDDIKSIREEFGSARKDNAENDQIPEWFGGDQTQWNAYREHEDKRIQQAEERAVKRLEDQKSQQSKLVEEATDYMKSEISTIQEDKTINPNGDKVDPNKLLKIVIDNDLVDSKGRWNYKAGWRIMQSNKKSNIGVTDEKKKISDASGGKPRAGESQSKSYKTAEDFKGRSPW